MERFNILMGVPVDHAVNEGILTILEFDVLGGFHLTTRESDVKGDIVCTFI